MKKKIKFKGRLKSYMCWPLYLTFVWICADGIALRYDRRLGYGMVGFTVFYFALVLFLYVRSKSVVANELISLYGEPMSSDDELSEGGATWKTWNVQDATIQLYKQSGLVSLEITPNYSEDNAHSFDTDQLYTGWLPKGVNQVMAETEPNKALEKAIIEYYEIPDDQLSTTKYYYNYVDLNGDGTDEIMAVIVGPYTSGTGGDSAIWGREFEGEFQLYQAFTLVNTPIIVTKDAVNGREFGSKRLILQRSGVSERETVELVANDGVYTNVADAETFEGLDQVEGTAIICNNMIKDLESKNYLTLGN